MTQHIGANASDGTPLSAADMARLHAEEELHAERQRKAARVVAATALGPEDCRLLLSILGLDAAAIADPHRAGTTPPTGRKPGRKRRAQAA